MKGNIYDGIITLVDISVNEHKRIIPKGTQGTIIECYENPEGYAVDLAIPDDKLVGGFDYENVILNSHQFEIVNTANAFSQTNR